MDIYPDLKRGKMALWIRTKKDCHKVLIDYDPIFFLRAKDGDHREAETHYENMGFETRLEKRRTDIHDREEREVLRVSPGKVFDPRKNADALDFFNGYQKYLFYNVDIPLGQRYLIENDISTFSLVEKNDGWRELEEHDSIRYSKPPLRTVKLDVKTHSDGLPKMDDRLLCVSLDGAEISGDEEEILNGLNKMIKKLDPDIVITSGGDTFLIPYLAYRSELHGVPLCLGRERSLHSPRQGSSYVSYGRVLYKPPTYTLKGRVHIDERSSFMYREGGIDGLIEIARLSKIPLQRLSRRSPGSAIDAMEIAQAVKDGYLIPWKKNITERFKTMRQLILSDRGGHIYTPVIGVHEDLVKLDFASMYPTIIDKYNLSPETLGCTCGDHHVVPELGYKVCSRKRGLIPKVVGPVVKRRQMYKSTPDDQIFKDRARVLKWLLVTCFGYTGYKKARFSNIEVHESITAYGRDILLEAADTAQEMGYEVVHGIVDSLWLKGDEDRVDELLSRVEEKTKVLLEREGKYSWVIFLASKGDPKIGVPNRYFGLLDDKLEFKGIHARRRDTPPLFKDCQKEVLRSMSNRRSREELFDGIDGYLDVVRRYAREIRSGVVDMEELHFTKITSKSAEEYEHMTETKAALLQYKEHGIRVHPGQVIRYVVTDAKSRDYKNKVSIEGYRGEYYDTGYYEKYLYRIGGEILAPFGFPEEKLRYVVKNL